MAEPLTAGITRDRAFELLNEHNKDPFHITHGETVEGTMRYFAREFDPENEEFWGIVGLLHDLDWEEHEDDPMNHTIYAAEILEGEGATPELIRAIQTHTSDFNTSLPVCLRRTHRPDRCCRDHAPEQERHGLYDQVAQKEIQGQALCRRLLA